MTINVPRIKLEMARRLMNQKRLALESGITERNIGRIFKRGSCSIESVGLLAGGLGLPVDDIVIISEGPIETNVPHRPSEHEIVDLDVLRIRQEMGKLGLTIKELEERSNVTRQNISTIIQRGTCMPKTAGKLAKGLRLDVGEIISSK